jgi:hypothetical protein
MRLTEIERSSFNRKYKVRAHPGIVLYAGIRFKLKVLFHNIAPEAGSTHIEEGMVAEVDDSGDIGAGLVIKFNAVILREPIGYETVAIARETRFSVKTQAVHPDSDPVAFLQHFPLPNEPVKAL